VKIEEEKKAVKWFWEERKCGQLENMAQKKIAKAGE